MKNAPFLVKLLVFKVLLLALAAGWAVSAVAHADDGITVQAQTVHDWKAVFATVESVDVVPARTRIGGTLRELLVDEGSMVEAGQLIGRVVDPKLELKLDAIEARISSLESERKLAQTARDRARKLRKSGSISQARLDEAETKFDVTVRNLSAMRSERKVIVEQQEEGAVFAPAGGRVIRVPVTQDSVVLPGEGIATIAANTYILRMQLPERHARFLKVGDLVQVGGRGLGATGSDGARELRPGRVQQIYPEIRQGRVVADVAVPDLGDFFVGERVQVFVKTGERKAFVIPRTYLFHRFGVSFVKLADGTEAVVQPGLELNGGIEVLSGLGEGDRLLPAGTAN